MDRRRTPRYVLTTPLAGNAMPMQDAMVERIAGDHLVVIAPTGRRPHEELMVHVAMPDGLDSRHAEVVSSTPVTVRGTLNFRLELLMGERS